MFLPLGFLTGLLGINVGGIPGANDKHAFAVVIAGLTGLLMAQLWRLKQRKWF
ncbi:MAG TPA: CorA family divalent cation transporter [Gammaproteobacteria bacterium]|nr:CorA family divalent cation transporter [Gammaproteobacteria bacterium]